MLLPVEETFAVIVVKDAGDDRNERCLAGAGRTYEHEKLSFVNVKIDAPKGRYLTFTAAEGFLTARQCTAIPAFIKVFSLNGQPLNTAAGSSFMTLRILIRAARIHMRSTTMGQAANSSQRR